MSLGNHVFIGVELSIKILISNDLYKLKWGYFLDNQTFNIKINELLHLGYNSIYETETILDFTKGVLVESKTYNNYIAKKSKFNLDPNPNNYLDFIYAQVDWEKIPDLKNNHIQVFIGIQPNKDGKIDSILSKYTYLLDSNRVITDKNNIFIKEAIRIAELIPNWDVVYQRGLITSRSFSIVFNENNRKKYSVHRDMLNK